MLYERWREVAREHATDTALRELATERHWTFAQLASEAERSATSTPDQSVVFPKGNSAEFIFSVLCAWRRQQVICPLEEGQTSPDIRPPPASA